MITQKFHHKIMITLYGLDFFALVSSYNRFENRKIQKLLMWLAGREEIYKIVSF